MSCFKADTNNPAMIKDCYRHKLKSKAPGDYRGLFMILAYITLPLMILLFNKIHSLFLPRGGKKTYATATADTSIYSPSPLRVKGANATATL